MPEAQIDDLLDAFEAEWRSNRKPKIADYLSKTQESTRMALLRDLVPMDLEYRLRAREPVRVEQYRNRYPGLCADDTQLVELLALECRVRLDTCEPIELSEYTGRFPALTVPLGRALEPYLRGTQEVPGHQLLDELGRGGMGTVLRAVDCGIRREVAVKFLLDDNDPAQKARFIDEAQITGQLEHPNIVPIHQLGVDAAGRCYFSMKMVRGRSLAQILKDLTPDFTRSRLLTIFVGICNAIAYAHSRRVIHRDIKPANIMIGDFGEIYVMDWGLAKPLTESATSADDANGTADTAMWMAGVQTNRADTELNTHVGTIMGTPAYMAPEQALGNVGAVNERSDIYSLGAILYEMLTLTPPVGRGGTVVDVIKRVVEGKIDPPDVRSPERARAGWISPELSAIAMKALALEPAQRYPTVSAMRDDIERYLEHRSVSAKRDAVHEVLWKFARRNKGLSAGLAIALCVLIASMGFLIASWRETNLALAAYKKEQTEKETRTRKAIPALLDAARQAIAQRRIEEALTNVAVALDYDPDNADALLLKGQILASRKQFASAAAEFSHCARLRPDDANTAKLAKICLGPDMEEAGVQHAIANILVAQRQPVLAMELLQPDKRLEFYRAQINSAWPGMGKALQIDKDHQLEFNLNPPSYANIPKNKFLDLSPLQGIPLTWLRIYNVDVQDLGPLQGMPLTHLHLARCPNLVKLEPLRGMPLETLVIAECKQVKSLGPLVGMPLRSVRIWVTPQGGGSPIDDLSPFKGMQLQELVLEAAQITSIEPLRGMPLRRLSLKNCRSLSNLEPLEGMSLQELNVGYTSVKELTSLKGMSLTSLECSHTRIANLSALEGMPLTRLGTINQVRNYTPLRGMNLESVDVTYSQFKASQGIDVLRNMKSIRLLNGYEADVFWRRIDTGELK